MKNETSITVTAFCTHHNVEIAFVSSLYESGLIETIHEGEDRSITYDQLPQLEKLVRLHYDMDINIEGIEAITFLLQRMSQLQHELSDLKQRVGLYE